MFFFKIFILSIFIIMIKSESYILGLDEIQNNSKYALIKKNKDFHKANLVAVLTEETNYVNTSIRPSRNIFGYTIYKIEIYQDEKLIYKKYFRLSSFNNLKRNSTKYDNNRHKKNKEMVIQYLLDLLILSDFSNPQKIQSELNNNKLKEPTSNMILFNEHGKMKAFHLNFQDFSHAIKIKEPLDIIPNILNKYDIKIIKNERIYNHGIYSHVIINDTIIKLPNKNYAEQLYRNLLKIEIIYLNNIEIFNEDSSMFFIEFDKLSEKTIEELIKIKLDLKKKSKGK